MKIVHLINSLTNLAGAELFVTNLAIKQASLGEKVYLISVHPNANSTILKKLKNGNVSYFCLNKKNKFDFSVNDVFIELIETIEPNIVNLHNSCLSVAYKAILQFEHIHFVKTVHSLYEIDIKCGDIFFQKRLVKRGKLGLIAISDAVSSSVKSKYRFDFDIKTILLGTNYENQFSVRKKLFNEDINFICVARHYPVKNHVLLIKAFARYLSLHNKSRLTLVGSGSETQRIKKLAKKLGCINNVIFVPETPNVIEFLKISDVFILTSKFEGFGMCVIEAFSCGLPAIVTRVGGLAEIVKDNFNGYTFINGSCDDCFKKMNTLYNNKDKIFKFSRNIVDNFDEYSIEKCAKIYISYYKNKL